MELRQLREGLGAALVGASSPLVAADRLCEACVDLLEVDGASLSLVHHGTMRGTFGSSGELSRELDELQFTFGSGPCLDSVAEGRPVFIDDLDHVAETRWPSLAGAMIERGVRAVYALPVAVASTPVGALDLYRNRSGRLEGASLTGGVWAAELASVPLLNLMTSEVDWATAAEGGDGWDQLASLERVEVYQATGFIVAALGVTSADALVRLRAHAITHGHTASEVAYQILERRLDVSSDDWRRTDTDGQAET